MWDTDDVQDASGPGRMALGHWDLELSSLCHAVKSKEINTVFAAKLAWHVAGNLLQASESSFSLRFPRLCLMCCAVQWLTWSP